VLMTSVQAYDDEECKSRGLTPMERSVHEEKSRSLVNSDGVFVRAAHLIDRDKSLRVANGSIAHSVDGAGSPGDGVDHLALPARVIARRRQLLRLLPSPPWGAPLRLVPECDTLPAARAGLF
jgi:hypothetical protein